MPFDFGGDTGGAVQSLTIEQNDGFALENQTDNAQNQCMTSPDGIVWTQRSTPRTQSGATLSSWNNVIYSPQLGLFAAVANSGASFSSPIMTSPDGINWTRRQLTPAAGNDFGVEDVAWSPSLGLFVAASTTPTSSRSFKSSDGITWTVDAGFPAGHTVHALTWSEPLGLFCGVATDGIAGQGVVTSPDGVVWTVRAQAVVSIWRDIVWSDIDSQFVAVSSDLTDAPTQVMTSPDGITWTARICPARQWSTITYSPQLGLYLAASDQGTGGNTRTMTSPNGVAWGEGNILANNDNWAGSAWSPQLGLFVLTAISGTGGARIATSPNGTSWTARTPPGLNRWRGLTYSPEKNLFVSVAQNQLTGGSAGTLTNAPSAGNPTFWAPVFVNGTRRHFPTW
jgi:hypothetical protein